MRYKNDGPVTLYVVMDVYTGEVLEAVTNKQDARTYMRLTRVSRAGDPDEENKMKLLTYDQRGTR